MSKYCLPRFVFRHGGFWLNFLGSNFTVRTTSKLLNPNVVGGLKQSASFNQKMPSITKIAMSQVRQNFHEESEDGINKQINLELYASYVYLSMAYHFDRDDVALLKISEYFKKSSLEEREHAMKLMKFQNQRGGTVVLKDVKAPPKGKWNSPLEAMEDALQLEKTVNEALLDLHKIASKHADAQMADFLESGYLHEQVEDIKKLGDHVTNLKRVEGGLGEYVFDKEFK